ncbi:nucleotide pyrophosphohydrolase [Candidatus Woesearchaeota archaeon CG_4_10_14_0_8_um_filter_47_5]|nr:MAG: nucleotide pyrophosphohydrolase [Candidatus Woesearchaeota archaeon CG_4_10_14_0_8_um_filter_47_5]
MNPDFNELLERMRTFNRERDWERFHNPKDLVLALVGEVGELAECYEWLGPAELSHVHADSVKKEKIEEEIADVCLYAMMLADTAGIDMLAAIERKLEKNRRKYPVEKSRGRHTNPLEGSKAVKR